MKTAAVVLLWLFVIVNAVYEMEECLPLYIWFSVALKKIVRVFYRATFHFRGKTSLKQAAHKFKLARH